MSRFSDGVDLTADALWTGRDDNPALKKAFRWLSKVGIGRSFPGTPIGWYQIHQCHAIDAITEDAKRANAEAGLRRVSVKDGDVYAGGTRLGSVSHYFRVADDRSRK